MYNVLANLSWEPDLFLEAHIACNLHNELARDEMCSYCGAFQHLYELIFISIFSLLCKTSIVS